jgi:hypothetical protein
MIVVEKTMGGKGDESGKEVRRKSGRALYA